MQFLYNISIQCYIVAIKIAALFMPKAQKAIEGRKNWEDKIASAVNSKDPWIWMHCSSLGEFEQGRPVLEALKKKYPSYKFALSFFSPSGYEIRKNYKKADLIFYLPFDTPKNAKKLAEIFEPKIWILAKYDYWYNHLKEQHNIGTNIIVVSAIFRQNHIYFKPYGKWFAQNLKQYIHHFFVQDKASKNLLNSIDISRVTFSGDTRFDRVKTIAKNTPPLIWVEKFKSNQNLIVIGSSWKEDEALWINFINNKLPNDWKVIVAPHEIKSDKIQNLKESLNRDTLLYSDLKRKLEKGEIPIALLNEAKVIIVDTIGLLSTIYASADLAYVGGGFNKSGVHNTLEPAVFGVPVIIGPNYEKFNEVKLLKSRGVLFSIENYQTFENVLLELMNSAEKRKEIQHKSKHFFAEQLLSTQIIVDSIDLD
ncbi:3-deoxy-D-manno-octulosonic acid transferase [Flavobacteriaceae bacterium Ap0902]|nr:3-deoxy-D-manno-octulosonic acid transferase [Flavobacteriaceae bacterium Ap0902]